MKRFQSRSGAAEASILMVLAVLLAIAVFGTLVRGQETSLHAARLELRTQLATALDSSLQEAWWNVDHAIPANGTPAKRKKKNPAVVKSLRSRVLQALKERTASPSTPPDPVPAPLAAAAVGALSLTLDTPEFVVYSVDAGGSTGLVGVRARGRASRGMRGGVAVSMTVEHRRRFHVTDTVLVYPGGQKTIPTVHIEPELVDAEVSES